MFGFFYIPCGDKCVTCCSPNLTFDSNSAICRGSYLDVEKSRVQTY